MGLLLIAPVSHFQSPGKDKEQTYRPIIIDHHEEMIIKWLRVVSLNYVMSCSQSLVLRYRNYLQLLYTIFNIFFATVVTLVVRYCMALAAVGSLQSLHPAAARLRLDPSPFRPFLETE